MQTAKPILKDTSLLMMVRDEMINPAGGIYPMLTMQAPLYEQAIVVDTGSKDGTYELLRQLQPKLGFELYQMPYQGFKQTRQMCESYVKTPYCMVLDADELVLPESVSHLEAVLTENKGLAGIRIPIQDVVPGFGEIRGQGGWNPRLHRPDSAQYKDIAGKGYLQVEGKIADAPGAKLLHFKPFTTKSCLEKQKKRASMEKSGKYDAYSGIPVWKQPDPKLLMEYGIESLYGKGLQDISDNEFEKYNLI